MTPAERCSDSVDSLLADPETVGHLRAVLRRAWQSGWAASELANSEHALAEAARAYVAWLEMEGRGPALAARRQESYDRLRELVQAYWKEQERP